MRRGLSLVELLVVLAIIGLLAALLLPAVQSAREAAHRAHCSSNMRQLALAIHSYESVQGSLPFGNSGSFSLHVSVLPQMEMQPLFHRIVSSGQLESRLPPELRRSSIWSFRCPSDGVGLPNATNYCGNMGYDSQVHGANGVFDHFGHDPEHGFYVTPFRLADVLDGTTNTALLGEILAGGAAPRRLHMNWVTAVSFPRGQREAFLSACLRQEFITIPSSGAAFGTKRGAPWLSGSAGTTLYTHDLTPNQLSCSNGSSIPQGAYTAASYHPDVVTVAYVDGHIAHVSSSVERAVWRAAATRHGNETLR